MTTSVNLTVVASNYDAVPQLNDSVTITITVMDVNDNRPMFDESDYSITIPENRTVPDDVILLEAMDNDEPNVSN